MTMSHDDDPPGAGDRDTTSKYDSSNSTKTIRAANGHNSSKLSSYSFTLLLLNLAAAIYLFSQQSRYHSTIQMGRKLQLLKLRNELESSESQIYILRYKMETLEHALVEMEEGEKSRIVRMNEDNGNVGRVQIDGENEQEQYEQLQRLENEKQSATDKFDSAVLEFQLVVDDYVDYATSMNHERLESHHVY